MGLIQSNFSSSFNNVYPIKSPERKLYSPGIYDISNEEYHSSQGVSRSGLMLFQKSPLHYADQYLYGNKKKESRSLYVGKAVHTYVLEPKKFEENYFIAEKVDGRTKEGKKRNDEILTEAKGKVVIKQDDYEVIQSLGNAILHHPTASLFLKNAQVEKSIFWRDCTTNVMVKCRPDIWLPNIVADIKTTEDASYEAFQRDIFKYGYDMQTGMIQDGIYHRTQKKIETFVFIAVEKQPPYAVAIYDIDKDIIEYGHQKYKTLLKNFRDHEESQDWSGYKTRTITLPAYYNN